MVAKGVDDLPYDRLARGPSLTWPSSGEARTVSTRAGPVREVINLRGEKSTISTTCTLPARWNAVKSDHLGFSPSGQLLLEGCGCCGLHRSALCLAAVALAIG